jgi:hypothetical protein
MTTPIVTEIPRALESVGHDTFIDGPVTPMRPAGHRSWYAVPRLVARASSERSTGRGERSLVQTLVA